MSVDLSGLDLPQILEGVVRRDFALSDPAVQAVLRDPRHLQAVRAANARPGPLDDDGQPVVAPRSANVQIVCAGNYRGKSCGRHLGGVWRTEFGNVLVYKLVRPDARNFVQAYKGRRRGPSLPHPGDRYPEDLLADEVNVLLDDADGVRVSCLIHGRWPLDLSAVRHCLEKERGSSYRQRYGSTPTG